MPLNVSCKTFPLSAQQIKLLWSTSLSCSDKPDQIVNIRCVSTAEIQRLNQQYRQQNNPTNILTFSYGHEHDLAISLAVIKKEAQLSKHPLKDYCALVLAHGFLHVLGFDHAASSDEKKMHKAEQTILKKSGFQELNW